MKVFTLALNVVILYELLHIDKIGRNLARRCRQARVVRKHESLACQVSDIVSTETAISHVTVIVHHLHVLLDVICGGAQCRNVWLKIHRERGQFLTLPLCLSLATNLLLGKAATCQRGQAEERYGCARKYSLFLLKGLLGD